MKHSNLYGHAGFISKSKFVFLDKKLMACGMHTDNS